VEEASVEEAVDASVGGEVGGPVPAFGRAAALRDLRAPGRRCTAELERGLKGGAYFVCRIVGDNFDSNPR